jgi:GNAT superfamily N-acetyltransferase
VPPDAGAVPAGDPAHDRAGSVRLAGRDDIEVVQAIAVAAGRRFAEIDEPRIARCADDPPPAVEDLLAAVADGRLWVAEEDDRAVGFLLALDLPRSVHVEEVSVHPAAQGRGHGAALLDAAADRARVRGVGEVTLTTFTDVPFNRPWYERRGFRVVGDGQLDDALAAIRADEAGHGLDPDLRVVMARALGAPGTD